MSPRPAPDPDSLVFCGLAFPEARCGETKVLPLAITNPSGVAAPLASPRRPASRSTAPPRASPPAPRSRPSAPPPRRRAGRSAFAWAGDEDVHVTALGATSDFALAEPLVVPAHGDATASITMTAGVAGDPISVPAALAVDEPVCGGLPSLVLEGQRTQISVSPTTIEAARRPRRGVCAERPRRSERHVPHEPSQPRDPREAEPGPVVCGALPPIEVDVR